MRPVDHFTKIVGWSEEDGCYVGRCPDLMLGGVHGPDRMAVYLELCEAVDEWLSQSPDLAAGSKR
ncbi:MAG: hypothetical protein FJX72_01135 [Armatimonadetes bacterium]|nr:hypothetical protein [Armatimonadota bacterium]